MGRSHGTLFCGAAMALKFEAAYLDEIASKMKSSTIEINCFDLLMLVTAGRSTLDELPSTSSIKSDIFKATERAQASLRKKFG